MELDAVDAALVVTGLAFGAGGVTGRTSSGELVNGTIDVTPNRSTPTST